MNDAELQELLDKMVAGRLSSQDEQRWSALLTQRPELEEEVALAEALRVLPKPPSVSSNFSSLVLQEVRRTKVGRNRSHTGGWLFLSRFLKLGATAAVVVLLAFSVSQRREVSQSRDAVETIASSVQAITHSPEVEAENTLAVFRDFEAIRQLPNTPGLDDRFLSALAR